MEVSIRQRGGLFPLNRTVKVRRERVSVNDGGRQSEAPLSSEAAERIAGLARRVATMQRASEGKRQAGPDSMRTDLVIRDTGSKAVRVRADDSSPDEVWELVGTISDAADATESGAR